MEYIETSEPIIGIENLETIHINRPTTMPYLDNDEIVVCILDCFIKYIVFFCEKLEDMQELYNNYAYSGNVRLISWYKTNKASYTAIGPLEDFNKKATITFSPVEKKKSEYLAQLERDVARMKSGKSIIEEKSEESEDLFAQLERDVARMKSGKSIIEEKSEESEDLSVQLEKDIARMKSGRSIIGEELEEPEYLAQLEKNIAITKSDKLPIKTKAAIETLKNKEHIRNITRNEMLAYLYLNIKGDYDAINTEELDNNTLFKICYLIRRYGDIYFSQLSAVKHSDLPFSKIEQLVREATSKTMPKISVYSLPNIYLECLGGTSFGYVEEKDERRQMTKAYFVNGERRREKQYQKAYKESNY